MNISDLLKLWRVEKGQSELAKMPNGLYKDGQALTKGTNPYEAKKAKDIYSDMVYMRQHKMLMGCLRHLQGGDKPENLLPGEKTAYNLIFSNLKALYDGKALAEVDLKDIPIIDENSNPKYSGAGDSEEETKEDAENINPEDVSDEIESELETGPLPASDESDDVGTEQREVEDRQTPEQIPSLESKEPANKDEPDSPSIEPKSEEKTHKEPKETTKKDAETTQTPSKEPGDKSAAEETKENNTVFKGETENKGLAKVRFLRSMPAFVGPDMKTLGPFEEDQVTELNNDIVEILINNDAVELI